MAMTEPEVSDSPKAGRVSYMRQALLTGPRSLSLQQVPLPEAGADGVLMRVHLALTCGTDLKMFRRGHPKFPFPTPLGHEFVGEVVEVGDLVVEETRARGLVPGARIVSAPSGPCGDGCAYCRRGQFNLCETLTSTMVFGAFGEFLRLPPRIWRHNAFPVPDGLTEAEAAFLEPLACCVHGVSRLQLEDAETAVVIGSGPIGLLFAKLLSLNGLKVTLVGRHASRLEAARQMGIMQVMDANRADPIETIRRQTGGLGVCLAVECTGRPEVWERSPELVRKGGEVMLFGGCPSGTRVSYCATRLHYDELTLRGAFHYTPTAVRQALDLLSSGKVKVTPLISGERPLDQLPDVFATLERGEGVKYIIRPQQG